MAARRKSSAKKLRALAADVQARPAAEESLRPEAVQPALARNLSAKQRRGVAAAAAAALGQPASVAQRAPEAATEPSARSQVPKVQPADRTLPKRPAHALRLQTAQQSSASAALSQQLQVPETMQAKRRRITARQLRSHTVSQKRFDLADPVVEEILQPLAEGSSVARVQRAAMAVVRSNMQSGGSTSSSVAKVAKLGSYGVDLSHAERDLHT